MSENDIYDIILDLKSLSDLKKGFPIYYSEKGRNKIDKFKNENCTVITEKGNSNQGKSFILSKIINMNFQSDYYSKTNGLSIIFPEENKNLFEKFIILDNEGSNSITILDEKINEIKNINNVEEKLEKLEEILRDKQMTENFLQDFVIDSSNIIIVVISKITLQELKLLNRIKEICKGKILLIIHNLMFLELKEEVEDYIEDTIETSIFFKFEKQSMINFFRNKNKNENENKIENDNNEKMDYFFFEEIDIGKKKKYIIHLIMAKEGTEAGNYYNQITIDFLKVYIISFQKQKKFDLIEEFKKFLCLNFNKYFDLSNINKNQLENNQIINMENIECDENLFKLNIDFDLKLKDCFIDEIGLLSYNGLIIIPQYNYFKKDDKFTIQIEYFDTIDYFKIKKYILNGQYKFNIKGKTKKKTNQKIISSNNINEGYFILSFSVNLDFMVIKSNKYKIENDTNNNILNIIYELGYQINDENTDGEYLGDDSKITIDDDIW